MALGSTVVNSSISADSLAAQLKRYAAIANHRMNDEFTDTDFCKLDPQFEVLYSYLLSLRHFGTEAAAQLKARYGKLGETPYWRFYFMRPVEELSAVPLSAQRLKISGKSKSLGTLREYQELKAVSVVDRFDEKALAILRELPNLRHLEMYNFAFPDLLVLQHFPRLENLSILDTRHLTSLKGLASVPNLQTLLLSGTKNLGTLISLKEAEQLRGLEISAALSGVSYNPQVLDSLAPLKTLRELRVFSLKAVRTEDDDLKPLIYLPALERVELPPREFSVNAMAEAAAAFPEYLELWSKPLGQAVPCRKCQTRKAILIGYRTRDVCGKCHPERLEKFFKEFREKVELARQKLGL